MLFGAGRQGTEVVLTERAHDLRSHAAQVSFPGGRIDPTDSGPVDAALRESTEEVGLERGSVTVIDTLPALHLAVSDNAVTPVLGWWHQPHPIGVVDPGEVAQVVRAPVDHLLDPAHRFTAVAPMLSTPGFDVHGLFVWGFTAMLLDHVFKLAGISRPWDAARERPVPTRLMADREP
jgi:8-oxo-dGTP pyrophosphatase MutT (NUDIX family)